MRTACHGRDVQTRTNGVHKFSPQLCKMARATPSFISQYHQLISETANSPPQQAKVRNRVDLAQGKAKRGRTVQGEPEATH
jgi:hypothetical protein